MDAKPEGSSPAAAMTLCGVCGQAASFKTRLCGYRHGSGYDLYECAQCRTSSVQPLLSAPEIYRAIYRQPLLIPGYARYVRYAETVVKRANPLRYLAEQEACYWVIEKGLAQRFPDRNASVLEVGCGMGYLTYAMVRAGYRRVLGVDWSEQAIAAARQRYGAIAADHYQVADIATFATQTSERFDAIVLSEVIEHLENPLAFLAAVRALLNPGGVLICTTPNRDFGGYAEQEWVTELPPVHLWWFGEASMRTLARRLGMAVELMDFSEWNHRHFRHFCKALQRSRSGEVIRKPFLDENLVPCAPPPSVRLGQDSRKRHFLDLWRNLLYRLRYSHQWSCADVHRSVYIGAVFRNDTDVQP